MLKFIMKLKSTSTTQSGVAGRTAGTTENHYLDGVAWTVAQKDAVRRVMNKRAALLGVNASIYGQTYAVISTPAKRSETADIYYPGTSTLLNDIPQAALKVTMTSPNKPNQKEMKVSFTPDARIVSGEYSDAAGYSTRFDNYCKSLVAEGLGFRGLSTTAPFGTLFRINVNGSIAFLEGVNPAGIVQGNWVRLLGAVTTRGERIKGNYRVRIEGGLMYLVGWENRDAIVEFIEGRLMKNEYIWCQYFWRGIENEPPQACTKKVGRPSDQYVGRRTKR